jgi:hypothetical protein
MDKVKIELGEFGASCEHHERRRRELVAIANSLSNQDAAILINMLSNRCDVFVGAIGGWQIASEIDWCCLNGVSIQINLKSVDDETLEIAAQRYHNKKLEEQKPMPKKRGRPKKEVTT